MWYSALAHFLRVWQTQPKQNYSLSFGTPESRSGLIFLHVRGAKFNRRYLQSQSLLLLDYMRANLAAIFIFNAQKNSKP
jgi:hypothetical protein